MNKLMKRVGVVLALAALSASMAIAAPEKAKAKKAEAPKCPDCKMTLTTKKDKMHTVAVKVKGKTYYCCAQCPMGKKAAGGKKAPAKDHSKMKM